MINIALPKGRLGEKAYRLLSSVGYACGGYDKNDRKLVFRDGQSGVTYFWVKPSDVAVYVELGAADVGVVGKDVLNEERPNVYELLDLNMGKCRMCVAAKSDFKDDFLTPLRVATKFVKSAEEYYSSIGREIRVIKLNGSVELAPIVGLSDVIFDIVETGATLKENGLQVITEVYPISTRFICNKAAYKFKREKLLSLTAKLQEAIGVEND